MAQPSQKKPTPLMEQYLKLKKQYPDALLFFQVGDFYELFFDDAVAASSFLAIALTKRGKMEDQDIPLCGVPVHALDHYLVKLIKGGFKVAICEQLTKPIPGKVVERGVTRVLSPGTLTDSVMLDEKSASYLFSLYPGHECWGLVFSELLTAQLFATHIPAGEYRKLEAELIRFLPDEVILPQLPKHHEVYAFFRKQGYSMSITDIKQDIIGPPLPSAWVERQFSKIVVEKLRRDAGVSETLAVLHAYLQKNNKAALSQFKTIQFYEPDDYLFLDATTQKNLEIVSNAHDGGRKNTLFSVMDSASCTSMGSRMLKKMLLRPLVNIEEIMKRQEVVERLFTHLSLREKLREILRSFADIERIVGRIALDRAHAHDYLALKDSLPFVEKIREIVRILLSSKKELILISLFFKKLADFTELYQLLERYLHDDPTSSLLIKSGADEELDVVRELLQNGKKKVHDLEKKEIARTGINSLKIGYNQVQGYYIEVTNTHLSRIPSDYISHQKLAQRHRFVTSELRDLEYALTKARTETDVIEKKVYERVKKDVRKYIHHIRQCAHILSYLDALQAFATIAYNNQYHAPQFHEGRDIIISQGRHAVVEQMVSSFIPNDTRLDDKASLWILTGPNMGGKSTYLRQVALILHLAHCGSFVPASSATLPILDRIFTRIGAGDDLAQGKSTFLVEMEETATICTQATKKSFIILDEVGRGTSTHDGMALAHAIVEYLYLIVQARALFATHYHELTILAQEKKGIASYYMKSTKTENGIVFLHELGAGTCGSSFGLEVARLASLPGAIIRRAEEILNDKQHIQPAERAIHNPDDIIELRQEMEFLKIMVKEQAEMLDPLEDVNLDHLTPRNAFDIIWKMKTKQRE